MGGVQLLLTLVAVGALLAVLFVLCRRSGLLTWGTAWLLSSREEKVGLTRTKGHYNANGYLVSSDSDIHLDVANGSFQRFDPVDRDFRLFNDSMTTTLQQATKYNAWGAPIPVAPEIPPQPLRPAPAPSSPTIPTSAPSRPPPPLPPRQMPPMPQVPAPSLPSSVPPPAFPAPSLPQSFQPPPFPAPSLPPPSQVLPSIPSPIQVSSFQAPLFEDSVFDAPPSPPPSVEQVLPPVAEAGPSEPEIKQEVTPIPVIPVATQVAAVVKEVEEHLPPSLKRAMSCDSLSSDTSVLIGDLEEPNVTGYLCIGLEYDKTLCFSDMSDLVVSVLEAKDLTGPDPSQPIDSYVRVYLLPDKSSSLQTRVYRNSNSPTYKEKFVLGMETTELAKRTLMFYVYASDKLSNTLIGEAELRLCDVTMRQPVTTWLTLTDTGQRGTEFGELMFSLSYLPTAERLTVVVVKARNLRFPLARENGDPFVKVYLLQHGKKVHKKKTSTKKAERSPIFNEAMIFSVPAHALQTIQLRLTVAENTGEPRAFSIGHVIVGSQATGKPLSHWNQMLTSLRKPIAMWHPLRK